MATNALTRLRNIFALEEKTGWRDRAVVGGMAALQERWSDDALAEGVDAGLVREVGARLVRYAEPGKTRPTPERPFDSGTCWTAGPSPAETKQGPAVGSISRHRSGGDQPEPGAPPPPQIPCLAIA